MRRGLSHRFPRLRRAHRNGGEDEDATKVARNATAPASHSSTCPSRPSPFRLPDSHMSASRSSLPPLGEAEWRGGVGWGVAGRGERATRVLRRLGQGSHRQPRLIVNEAPRGSAPHPALGSAPSRPPRHSLRERGEGGGARRRPSCVNAVALGREGVSSEPRGFLENSP